MSVTSKTNAVLHLVNTYNLMKNIKNYNDTDDTVQDQDTDESTTEISETTNENIETGLEENDPNSFQLYLQSLSQGVPSSSQSSSSNTDTVSISISSLLNLYFNQPILPHTETILSYWESKKFECPELYALSHVVIAFPTTQVL